MRKLLHRLEYEVRDIIEFATVPAVVTMLLSYIGFVILAAGFNVLTETSFNPLLGGFVAIAVVWLFCGTAMGWCDGKEDFGRGVFMLSSLVLSPVTFAWLGHHTNPDLAQRFIGGKFWVSEFIIACMIVEGIVEAVMKFAEKPQAKPV